jgi:hypothetical protein
VDISIRRGGLGWNYYYAEGNKLNRKAPGFADQVYFKALLKMFEAALKISITLQRDLHDALFGRLPASSTA